MGQEPFHFLARFQCSMYLISAKVVSHPQESDVAGTLSLLRACASFYRFYQHESFHAAIIFFGIVWLSHLKLSKNNFDIIQNDSLTTLYIDGRIIGTVLVFPQALFWFLPMSNV